MTIAALIVAAGRGLRAGGARPKQYQDLAGQTVLGRSLAAITAHPLVKIAVVVVHPEDRALIAASVLAPEDVALRLVDGGETRDASVRAGLAALPAACERVLIHDAARPLLPLAVIERVLKALDAHDGAAPGLALTDALWRGAAGGAIVAAVPREGLWRAQTPQGFRVPAIRAAHAAAAAAAGPGEPPPADDVAVALAAGLDVAVVDGDYENIKITLPGDLYRAAAILAARAAPARAEGNTDAMVDLRLGNGFDVHAFGPGAAVTLCGVPVPHDRGLVGHSDADVGMHALTDAIYGALAEGDIGRHFPPSDPQWKGADSRVFLAHAAGLAAQRGFALANADVTMICERPKIGPHVEAMRVALAGILRTGVERISVKATTSERLGFTGREEGIAALATVALVAEGGQ